MPVTITALRSFPARKPDLDVDTDSESSDGGGSLTTDAPSRPSKRLRRTFPDSLVTPGEAITDDPQWMRGHGTHLSPDGTAIISSVAGVVTRTNKLLSVRPLHARYMPEIGDLVVGRVIEVQLRRWRVDIGASQLASLQLSAINLPGGVLRKRTDTDELQIRTFFAEGDALVCEVQQLHGDGGAALHTRSLRYGKLRNGVFVAVGGAAGGDGTGGGVVRAKRHVWTMDAAGASAPIDVVLGVNGYVWVCKHVEGSVGSVSQHGGVDLPGLNRLEEAVSLAAYSSRNETIDMATMREVSRVRSVIVALVEHGLRVDEDMVRRAYDEAVDMARESIEDNIYLGGERGLRLANALSVS